MTDVSIVYLQQAVEGFHECKAWFREKVQVSDTFESDVDWERDVFVFDLENHHSAKKCYAWSSQVNNSDNRRFFAVLHGGPVKSAKDAIRASIVSNYGG